MGGIYASHQPASRLFSQLQPSRVHRRHHHLFTGGHRVYSSRRPPNRQAEFVADERNKLLTASKDRLATLLSSFFSSSTSIQFWSAPSQRSNSLGFRGEKQKRICELPALFKGSTFPTGFPIFSKATTVQYSPTGCLIHVIEEPCALYLYLKTRMDSTQSAAAGGNGTLISPTNDMVASAAGADDSMQKLNQVSNSIQKTLGLIHQLYLTVSTFNAAFQMPLLERINGLVLELDNMVKLVEKCNIQVPMEVVNLIDDGKNPDEFTKDVINNCIAKNQITKGKTDALKSLRKHLLEELEQNFPDEVETFRESRAAAAAELKRQAQAQSVLANGDVRVKSEH
ncbi:hypothetical protein RJT34_03650 [Clitoria ternatea]|uniref:Mediator of RNA polymerase II transcription subunit 10 n=1 Tax=Clitoria ternatea TaxID=43366 RepID=A0AAN9KM11_CLITE